MAALRLAGHVEGTSHGSGVYPAAKALPRVVTCSADRVVRAEALDAAMTALGVRNSQLAAWCAVDEKTVRCWRLGSLRFSDDRVDEMRSVGAEFRRRIQCGEGG